MNLFHKKSRWERALPPALRMARKSGKALLGIVGVATAATAASAAASVRRESS
jgi:hypothetical protein